MKRCIMIGVLGLCASGLVQAGEWSGSVELGFANATGNSRDTAFNGRFGFLHENERWNHELFGDAYYKRSDGERTADHSQLGYKPRYNLSERDYLFGTLRYERDRFSDIRHRWTQVGGYGRKLIRTPTTLLEAEIGAGARQTRYIDNPDNLDRSEGILYVGGKFTHDISDTAQFLQTVRVDFGDDNTFTESVTGLKMRVTDTIAAKLTHTIRHNSDVRGSRGKRTDQFTGVNLVYSF